MRCVHRPRRALPPLTRRAAQVATLGLRPWWKKHLTSAQIIQFCLDVPATAIATTLKVRIGSLCCACDLSRLSTHGSQMNAAFKWGWFGGMNTDCGCDSLYAAYFGTGLLLSYLVRRCTPVRRLSCAP